MRFLLTLESKKFPALLPVNYQYPLSAVIYKIMWVSGEEPEHTFGYYCGLNSEIFSPAEQLADEEMILIRKAFGKNL